MITQPIIAGTNAYLALLGGAVTATAKPAAPAGYTSLGDTAEGSEVVHSVGVTRTVRKHIGGGRLVRAKILEGKRDIDIKLVLEDYSDLISALTFGHEATVTGGEFKPGERTGAVEGWLKFELDSAAGKIVTLEVLVRIALDGNVKFGDNGPQPPVICNMLYSAQNTGTLLAAA